MRGLSVAFGSAGCLSRRFSQRALTRYDSTLRAAPAGFADRSRHLITTFHSPAAVVPSRNLRDGINVPGLLLQHPTGLPIHPFGFWAPLPTSGLPPDWSRSPPLARCEPANPATANPPRTSAPLLGFHPSGSQRSVRFLFARLTSPRSPIPHRSPSTLLLTCANGSTFRVRYFP